MPSTPRRTPGSQSPAGRASSRRPAGTGGRSGAARGGRTEKPAEEPRTRPTRRPGARRTTASTGADRRFNRRSGGRFTGRAAIVAAVVAVLILTLAYPMQEYLAQRSQIVAAEQDQAEQLERIADKEDRKERWNDPAYVVAQAGKRFGLVEPGVVVYIVKEDPSVPPDTTGQPAGRTSNKSPWFTQLWSSVKAADKTGGKDSGK